MLSGEFKKEISRPKDQDQAESKRFKKGRSQDWGGPNEAHGTLTSIDSKMIQFIGSESIEGIVGGVDTFASQRPVCARPSTSQVAKVLEPGLEFFVPEAPSVLPPIQNPPATPAVPAPPGLSRPLKRKRAKTQALEEIRESRQLQMETNNLLKELVQEVKEQNVLKRRKLELLEQMYTSSNDVRQAVAASDLSTLHLTTSPIPRHLHYLSCHVTPRPRYAEGLMLFCRLLHQSSEMRLHCVPFSLFMETTVTLGKPIFHIANRTSLFDCNTNSRVTATIKFSINIKLLNNIEKDTKLRYSF
ncbi:hypothetical protein FQR65_LT09487 [Abscondita terminalis]|nr:hypothetical protein FQR65_LT09487 [Abscondita terminalis]